MPTAFGHFGEWDGGNEVPRNGSLAEADVAVLQGMLPRERPVSDVIAEGTKSGPQAFRSPSPPFRH